MATAAGSPRGKYAAVVQERVGKVKHLRTDAMKEFNELGKARHKAAL
jgi:hypothetical protein